MLVPSIIMFVMGANAHFMPLGGFHGNVIPMPLLSLSEAQCRELEPNLWEDHLDICDAPEPVLRQWFQYLADNGVTSLRLFPRTHLTFDQGLDVLDFCGEVNEELRESFHRVFAAAESYNIHFLLQIMPEPVRTGYLTPKALEDHVLPRLTQQQLDNLTPAQKRFIIDRKHVSMAEYFTAPDVLTCQKLYLQRILEWIADEPQIFALEIFNEQGWGGIQINGKWEYSLNYPWEEAEIRWSSEIVKAIKERLPDMQVCLSHAGFGLTGFDPIKWSQGAGVDFYSPHLYAGLCGARNDIDFAAVTAATSAVIGAEMVNLIGEWGILNSEAPEAIRKRSHRDAIWLTLMTGAQGFMQWEYDFLEEYGWIHRIFQALPDTFSPAPPEFAVEIGFAYRNFQDNARYPQFSADQWFSPWEFNKQKQGDENIQKIFAAYQRSLELSLPIRFVMDQDGAMPLDKFLSLNSIPDRPIQAIGGYQMAYLKDAGSNTWVGYLHSRRVENFNGHFLSVPEERPLSIRLNLSAGKYAVYIVNLDTDKMQRHDIADHMEINIADNTRDDYAFLIIGRDVELDPHF